MLPLPTDNTVQATSNLRQGAAETRLKVWWVAQIPGPSFEVEVTSVADGVKLMETLANYDLFQFENKIKPDYANAGGLLMLDADGEWIAWEDPKTGEDDPVAWLAEQQDQDTAA